jgi:cytochrome P450
VIEAKTRLSDKRAPTGYYTIVDELLRADLPEVEKRTQRLALETQGLIAAANETTGTSLSLATYYLYSNKAKFKKLEEELLALSPDRSIPSLAKLEALPYLGAVVIEVLRLSGGPLSRLPRVFPEDATVLRSSHKGQVVEYTVPPGTVLSMSSFYVHRNPELFPNPEEFSPERWLDEKGKRKKEKERYLLHFSKGTRGCVGLNLANAEMYLTIAALVLQVGERLELFETGVRDVTPDYDGFAPRVYRGSKGIRVVIK